MTKYEYFKLDEIDIEVILWIHERYPLALMNSLEYMKEQYTKKGIDLDIEKIYKELNKVIELWK